MQEIDVFKESFISGMQALSGWPLALILVLLSLLVMSLLLNLLLLEYLLGYFDPQGPQLGSLANPAAKMLIIITVILFADHLLSGLLQCQTARSEALKNSNGIVLGITAVLFLASAAWCCWAQWVFQSRRSLPPSARPYHNSPVA